MYVCLCHGFNEGQVRQAKCNGACRASDVYKQLGVRPQCGRCVGHVSDILSEPAHSHRQETAANAD